jgi:hypothetical protein
MWNDPLLSSLNPNITLPSTAIVLVVSLAATEATLLLTERLASFYQPFGDAIGNHLLCSSYFSHLYVIDG